MIQHFGEVPFPFRQKMHTFRFLHSQHKEDNILEERFKSQKMKITYFHDSIALPPYSNKNRDHCKVV